MLDFKMLEAFVAVAEELHFGRAAQRLHIAQPPVSQRIRALEQELAVQLFERTTRSVRLTPSGDVLLPAARKILQDLDDAEMACRAAGTGVVGKVSIGFAGASSHADLPVLAQAVRRNFPGIELVLHGQTYADVAVELVGSGELDLGFARLPVDDPRVSHRVIGAERLICALPANHPAAQQKVIDLANLADQPFVTFPANSGSTLRDATVNACRDSGFVPTVAQEAPDSHTILSLVAAGVGVTLTLSSVRHVQKVGIAYRPIAGDHSPLHPVLVWRSNNPSKPLQRVLEVAETVLPSVASTVGPAGQPDD